MQRSSSKAMDIKKTQSGSSSKEASGKKAIEFVGDVKQELKKVEWTNKEELRAYTKVILASTFLFGMGVYFADLFIQGCLNTVNMLLKFIVG